MATKDRRRNEDSRESVRTRRTRLTAESADPAAAPKRKQASGSAFVAPGNALEEQLVAIFQEVLGVERLGVFDNIFELGGESLQAAQIISRLQHEFGVEMSVRTMLRAPTVARLAPLVAAALTAAGGGPSTTTRDRSAAEGAANTRTPPDSTANSLQKTRD